MSCNINTGIARGCRDNAGGIYQFFIASYPTVLDVTTETGVTFNGEIKDVVDGSATPIDFFPFVPNKNTGDFTETYQISIENGTVGYEQKVSMVFSKMEAAKANSIKMLATGDALIVVKDKNGNYFLIGQEDAAVLSSGSAASGKALTDLNGYVIELMALEGNPANQILDSSIVIDAITGNLTVESI